LETFCCAATLTVPNSNKLSRRTALIRPKLLEASNPVSDLQIIKGLGARSDVSPNNKRVRERIARSPACREPGGWAGGKSLFAGQEEAVSGLIVGTLPSGCIVTWASRVEGPTENLPKLAPARYGITVIPQCGSTLTVARASAFGPTRGVGSDLKRCRNCSPGHIGSTNEQYRAIGWVGDRLYSVIFEIHEDEEGEILHLVTLWRATKEEVCLYEENF